MVLVLAGVGLVSGACSELEYATMQASFSNCSSEFTQNTEDICQLLESVVGECSKHWLSCHDQREVGKMRDLHINHLIKSYQESNNLEDCLVVKEYRYEQSGSLHSSNILLPGEILFSILVAGN